MAALRNWARTIVVG